MVIRECRSEIFVSVHQVQSSMSRHVKFAPFFLSHQNQLLFSKRKVVQNRLPDLFYPTKSMDSAGTPRLPAKSKIWPGENLLRDLCLIHQGGVLLLGESPQIGAMSADGALIEGVMYMY